MYEQLLVTPARVNLMMILATLSGAVAIPVWGRLIDCHGCRSVLLVSLVAWEIPNYLWIFLTPDIAWLLYPMFLWGGLTSAGFFLGIFNLLLKLVSRAGRTAGVSLYLGVTSLATGAAPVVAGLLLGWAARSDFDEATFYRAGFFLRSTGILAVTIFIVKLSEPESGVAFTVVGALRTFRQSLVTQASSAAAMPVSPTGITKAAP